MINQTKSKQRVADHGEVFTAEREVKAMCDLVKQETERIESRFLEPPAAMATFWRKFSPANYRWSRVATGKVPLTTKNTLSWLLPAFTA